MKPQLFLSVIFLAAALSVSAQVSVSVDGSSPDPSAMLDVKSTSKGMLIPRMTSTQRTGISSPAVGLLVYDLTTDSFWFYNTGGWIELVAGNEFNPAVIHDADNDTKIQTEKNADEDVIRFDLGGTEKMVLTGNRLEIGDANRNLFLGQGAGLTNTGIDNTALGFQSMYNNNTGNENTATGTQSLMYNVSGIRNTATGYRSLLHNTEGSFNTATGFQSMHDNLTGNYNSALGFYSLILNKYGSYNTGLGCFASYFNQFGSKNTAVGYSALYSSNMGNSSVAIGYGAGYYETYDNRLYIDNQTRSSLNDGRSKALIYGIFDADPVNQKLTFNANVGIGTTGPTNKLHVYAASNPLRLEGLQTSANNDFLVVDADGVVSKRVGGMGSGWSLTGNAGTDPSTNFLGTTDNASLVFRANNFKSGWIDLAQQNTSFGYRSLGLNTSGLNNTATGMNALYGNTSGSNNTAFGENALSSSSGASNITAIGRRALYYSNGGDDNTAVGSEAMYFTSSGWGNSSLGRASLYTNTTGYMNTCMGYYAAYFNSTGRHNTGIGAYSLYMNSTGQYNTATGSYSLEYNTAYSNTANGFQSIMNNNSGSENSVFGAEALAQNTTGSGNVAMGYGAGFFETGSNKLYIDNRKHSNESDGRSQALVYGVFDADPANQKLALNANVGIGTIDPLNKLHVVADTDPLRLEGLQMTTNDNFLVVDDYGVVSKRTDGAGGTGWALTGNSGTDPTINFIGTTDNKPLVFRTNNLNSGSIDIVNSNTSFGYGTYQEQNPGGSNTAFGQDAMGHNTGFGNVAIGLEAMYWNSGSSNVAVGYNAMMNNASGDENTAIGVEAMYGYGLGGSSNTAVGYSSLNWIGSGYKNTVIGERSGTNINEGFENTAIGAEALASNLSGSGNIAIGNQAGFFESGSNRLYIDNQQRANLSDSREKALVYGVFDAEPNNQRLTVNGRLGVGTSDPDVMLEVKSITMPQGLGSLRLSGNNGTERFEGVSNTFALFQGQRCRGTIEEPLAVQSGDILVGITGRGCDGTSFPVTSSSAAQILAEATETYSSTAHGSAWKFLTTKDGTNSAIERMRIDQSGAVGIGTSSPDASAALDVTSISRGLLPPRMTDAQMDAISNPADGLIVYNTTDQHICIYSSEAGSWKKMTIENEIPCGSSFTVHHSEEDGAPFSGNITYGTILSDITGTEKCWITQNLGAERPATSYSDETIASSGWYWQFNHAQGYYHNGLLRVPITIWITSINENSNWQPSNDPCSNLLGSDWRLPTFDEWINADQNGGWNNYLDTYYSPLKLHAAGFLPSNTGWISSRGITGHYWSSTQNSTTIGWDLGINDSQCMILYSMEKANGFSVRCLRD